MIMKANSKQIRICFGFIILFINLICYAENKIDNLKNSSYFIQITDTHISESVETLQNLEKILTDIKQLSQRPDFIINTGDITEFGSAIEFEHYRTIIDSSGLNFDHALGNHDVRWSNIGKKQFVKWLGPLYRSFETAGIHFIILDSGLLLEQYGHFSQQQLNWLQQELKNIGSEKPIILAAHHPVFLERKYVDNEFEFLELLDGYNIILFLCGHGHRNQHWQLNGIDFLMTGAVKSASPNYRLFERDNDSLRIYIRNLTEQSIIQDFSCSLNHHKKKPKFSINQPESKQLYDKTLPISIHSQDVSRIDVSLDGINWETLKPNHHQFTINLNVKDFSEGNHFLKIKLFCNAGKLWMFRCPIQIGYQKQNLVSRFKTGDAILASPAIIDDMALVGSLDSNLYAIDAENMNLLWSFKTSGPIVTSPVNHEDTIFVTSGDGFSYALNKQNGTPIWKAKAGEAIFSSPTYMNGKIIFGSSDSSLYSFRSADGKLLWKFKTDDHIKARPAVYDNKVFVGSWDRNFYCISAADGNLVWKQKISDNRYFPAATSNPLVFNDDIIVSSHDHVVHAFKAQNGALAWQHLTNDWTKPGYSSPIASENTIYFGSLTGHLFSLDAHSGREIWAIALPDTINPDPIFDSSPVIHNSSVISGSIGGVIYMVDKDTGKLQWSFKLNDYYIFSSPQVWKQYIFVGSCDGYLYKIRMQQ